MLPYSILPYCLETTKSNAQQTKIITIDDAIAIALQNNNSLKATALNVQSANALKATAKELPKLDLSAQLGQYNSTRFDQLFQISQNIPFPSLFGARSNKIKADVRRQELNRAITKNELTKEVRSYYYQMEYLLYNRSRLRYLDSLYGEFIRVAKVRFSAGDVKKIEISTVETKKGEINLLLQQNETYLANAQENLKILLNISDHLIIPVINYSPMQAKTIIDTTAIANHPTISTIYQDMEVAEASKKIERAQGLPDFTLGYTNQSLIGTQMVNAQERYFGSGNRFSSVNLGIAIPLSFGATKARIRSLDFQQQALAAESQNETAGANSTVTECY